jgi:surface-anchored protein
MACVPCLLLALPSAEHELIDEGHTDFVFCRSAGAWTVGLVWHRTNDPLQTGPALGPVRPTHFGVLQVPDLPYPDGGRVRRPAAPFNDPERWDFLGMPEGEPLWFLSQSSGSRLWAGLNVCDDGCHPYFEADPRVEAVASWRLLQLKGKRYVGLGSGHFSQWTSAPTGEPTVWVSTADGGISEKDTLYVGGSGHAHLNWGFSSPGLYQTDFSMTCFEGPDRTIPVTSPSVPFFFAVGGYWVWLAKHFTPDRWWAPGFIGQSDDPDGDDVPNLLEYVFGLHPRIADAHPHVPGSAHGLPAIVDETTPAAPLRVLFARPTAESAPQIITIPQWAPTLAGPWQEILPTATTPLDHGREEVEIRLPPDSEGYFRLHAELISSPEYTTP